MRVCLKSQKHKQNLKISVMYELHLPFILMCSHACSFYKQWLSFICLLTRINNVNFQKMLLQCKSNAWALSIQSIVSCHVFQTLLLVSFVESVRYKNLLNSMAELWPREPRLIPLWQQIGRTINYHRWAGLSGATAIVFTAYLENDGKLSNTDKHFIALANQINYIHALALLAMPIARRPNLVRIFFGLNEFLLFFCFNFLNIHILSFSCKYSLDHYFCLEWPFIVLDAIYVPFSISMDLL